MCRIVKMMLVRATRGRQVFVKSNFCQVIMLSFRNSASTLRSTVGGWELQISDIFHIGDEHNLRIRKGTDGEEGTDAVFSGTATVITNYVIGIRCRVSFDGDNMEE